MTTLLAFCHALGREISIPHPSFRLVALVIAQHCKPLSGDGAYPAMRTVAIKCGLTKSTVHRAVQWLTQTGWLEVTSGTGFGQGWRRNRYRLLIPKGVPRKVGHVPRRTPYKKIFNVSNEQKTGVNALWKDVLEAIRRCGRYRVPDLPPKVLEAIRSLGGWSAVCGAMEVDLRLGGPMYQRFKAAMTV